jgi:hypothetical protein
VRLPPQGVPFSGTIELDEMVYATVGAPLDGSEPPGVDLALVLDLTPTLFDGVGLAFFVEDNFLDLNIPPGFVENDIATNVVESTTVAATVERHEVELATGPVLFPQGGNNTQGDSP